MTANVELAYAKTVHGAQGSTVITAHLVLDENSTASGAYVGMTRGRIANTAHLIAADHDQARKQWVTAFGRDRADLGPAAAREAAQRDAARSAPAHPVPARPQPEPVEVVNPLAEQARLWLIREELRRAWNAGAIQADRLERALQLRDDRRGAARVHAAADATITPLKAAYETARAAAARADTAAAASAAALQAETEHTRDALIADWDAQLPAARAAARTVQRGPGPLGLRLPAVHRSSEELARWSVRWQPVLPTMPTHHDEIARHANRYQHPPSIYRQVEDYARALAQTHHPDHADLDAAAQHAHDDVDVDVDVDQAGRGSSDWQRRGPQRPCARCTASFR